jgi:hypothetical protein
MTQSQPSTTLSPPPPHDPRDREGVLALGAWEVRLSTGRFFEYFAPRGLWHAQLWHQRAGVSILTPSRLTGGSFEAFPSRGWKGRRATYSEIRALVAAEHDVEPPSMEAVTWLEDFVRRIVAGREIPS